MRKILFLFCFVTTPVASAQVWVDDYYRSDGTHVEGHYRSEPDGIEENNWSYPGNNNPYDGVDRQDYDEPDYYNEPPDDYYDEAYDDYPEDDPPPRSSGTSGSPPAVSIPSSDRVPKVSSTPSDSSSVYAYSTPRVDPPSPSERRTRHLFFALVLAVAAFFVVRHGLRTHADYDYHPVVGVGAGVFAFWLIENSFLLEIIGYVGIVSMFWLFHYAVKLCPSNVSRYFTLVFSSITYMLYYKYLFILSLEFGDYNHNNNDGFMVGMILFLGVVMTFVVMIPMSVWVEPFDRHKRK